jgi:ornithine cyclodeaminase/alanine dehydrogenase-like protein (mu-crystallin family)
MLVLSAEDVRRALPMSEAITAMRRALMAISGTAAQVPLRTHLRVDNQRGALLIMPAYVAADGSESLAVKVVSSFGHNPDINLPRVQAVVVALDPQTGAPLAILEGATLTAIRTAAASAVATDLLARQNCHTLAIIGSGVQARSHIQAICNVRDIQLIKIYSRRATSVDELISEMATQGIDCEFQNADTPANALQGADIVCTASTSPVPVFVNKDLSPGVHINAIGSYGRHGTEIPAETVVRARIFVDERRAALAESSDLIQAIERGLISADHIVGEIGEFLLARTAGRTSDEEITLFKSLGNAAEDAAAASVALENAKANVIGQVVEWV